MHPRAVCIKRIALGKPPNDWFYGIAGQYYTIYRQAFINLGIAVFDVPVDAFVPPDPGRISGLLADLKAFKPQFACGFDCTHVLVCRFPALRDGSRPNLFTDILDIPTICLWDHAPTQIAEQLLQPHPSGPATSQPGAMEALRRVLTHPRVIHWSFDTGQTRILTDLGFLLPGHVIQDVPPLVPLDLPVDGFPGGTESVAGFVGHVYQDSPQYPHPALASLADDVIRSWSSAFDQPFWDLLAGHISGMPDNLRRDLALDTDQSYFWPFANQLITRHAQTCFRLKMLEAAGMPVVCYGNLKAHLPGVSGMLLPAPRVGFGPELAATFARHAITIDALNPGFVNGYSDKQIFCFAAGGLSLLNRKQDFIDAFGDAGEAVSYRDAGDLARKADLFLSKPKYRREVGDAIREKIAAGFQLNDVLRRALECADESAGPALSRPLRKERPQNSPQVNVVVDLLQFRAEPFWQGAVVEREDLGVRVSTPEEPWTCGAKVNLPSIVSELSEPHLVLRVLVECGRIGLAGIRDYTEELVGEQWVGPSADPVTVTIELPHHGVSRLILRNTAEIASRVSILSASLCDRTIVPEFSTRPGRIAERFKDWGRQLRENDAIGRVLEHVGFAAAPSGSPANQNRQVTTLRDLLPQLRVEPWWRGASVRHSELGARVSTPAQAWLYAATIDIPSEVSTMNEPHLAMSLVVESGRIGIAALLDETGELVAEKWVPAGAEAVTVTVELPRQGAGSVILRNAAQTQTHALVLSAKLCDRTAVPETLPPAGKLAALLKAAWGR